MENILLKQFTMSEVSEEMSHPGGGGAGAEPGNEPVEDETYAYPDEEGKRKLSKVCFRK